MISVFLFFFGGIEINDQHGFSDQFNTFPVLLIITLHSFSMPKKSLTKPEFHDAIRLRQGLPSHGMPNRCGCGLETYVVYSKNCKIGNYIDKLHNSIRDFIRKSNDEG